MGVPRFIAIFQLRTRIGTGVERIGFSREGAQREEHVHDINDEIYVLGLKVRPCLAQGTEVVPELLQ